MNGDLDAYLKTHRARKSCQMTVTVDWLSTPHKLNKHLLPTSSPSIPTPFKLKKRHLLDLDQRSQKRKLEDTKVRRFTVLEQLDDIVRVLSTDGIEMEVKLGGDWRELQLDIGTEINIIRTDVDKAVDITFESKDKDSGGLVGISDLNLDEQLLVDNNQGFLVVDPDRLISATTVSDSFTCSRKTVLNQKISNFGYSWPLLKGTLLHSLFQARNNLEAEISNLMEKSWDNMYVLDLNEYQLVEKLMPEVKLIKDWYSKNNDVDVVDIEQKIWSFEYGLKGNVDMTVKQGQQLIPLELKTGKAHYSHRAQTSLYAMMMSNFNNQNLDKGILVYLNTVETIEVGTNLAEQRGLLMGRNRLVTNKIPPMIENMQTCKNCFAKQECAIYTRAMEKDKNYSQETMSFVNDLTSALTPNHLEFLKYWEELIAVEESSKLAVKRESINQLKLKESKTLDSNDSKFCYQLQFVLDTTNSEKSILDSNLAIGDPILVSEYQERNPIALGYISNINTNSITIYTDKNVGTQANEYKISSDRFANNLGLIRGALYNLFQPDNVLRDYIVDLKKPEYTRVGQEMMNPIRGFLNHDQQKAVLHALSSHKYSLILGMPGTGKTTTMYYSLIVHIWSSY